MAEDDDEAANADSPDDAPLADLRNRLVGRRDSDEEDTASTFDRFDETTPPESGTTSEDAWSVLRRDVTRRANAFDRMAERRAPRSPGRPGRGVSRHRSATSLRDNFRVHVLATHGFTTFVLFGLGIGLMGTAVASVIPTPFWLFSLPLLLMALVGVLPIAAWALGLWDPQQI